MQQLVSYLSSYTKGNHNQRISKATSEGVCEVLRDVIPKGKKRNKNKFVTLKVTVLGPPRANKPNEVTKILTDWKRTQFLIKQDEPSYSLDDDTLITLLFKIMPKDYIKEMREKR